MWPWVKIKIPYPSEHPNPTTKIGSLKWVVNSPNPTKMGSKTVLTTTWLPFLVFSRWLQVPHAPAPGPTGRSELLHVLQPGAARAGRLSRSRMETEHWTHSGWRGWCCVLGSYGTESLSCGELFAVLEASNSLASGLVCEGSLWFVVGQQRALQKAIARTPGVGCSMVLGSSLDCRFGVAGVAFWARKGTEVVSGLRCWAESNSANDILHPIVNKIWGMHLL